MRTLILLIQCLTIFCAGAWCRAQGTFQNLGFESAALVPASANKVQFAPAFPGWTGSVGGVQQGTALYNDAALDSSAISIIDHGWTGVFFTGAGGVINGNFTAILQAGVTGLANTPADTTLSQTGLVPGTAQSLRFQGYLLADGPAELVVVVTLGGQQLSLTPLASGTSYTLYGADIHALAGQTAELDFTVRAERPHVNNQYLFLDSIQFSNQPVPEPSIFGLSALGALLLGWHVLGRRR